MPRRPGRLYVPLIIGIILSGAAILERPGIKYDR